MTQVIDPNAIKEYHFMFGPEYTAGCPSCSAIADGFDDFVVHLANHDVTLSVVSRAPLAEDIFPVVTPAVRLSGAKHIS